jgi:hypothetical protein
VLQSAWEPLTKVNLPWLSDSAPHANQWLLEVVCASISSGISPRADISGCASARGFSC